MKKSIGILSGFVLLFSACGTNVEPTPTPVVPEPELETYESAEYGFEFQYSEDWETRTPDSPYANLEEKIVALELPRETYPGTNFGEAVFAVSAQKVDSLEACLELNPLDNATDPFSMDKTESVNGVTFYTSSGVGAAAGNTYEYKTKRTYQNGNCFEVSETVHTSNIENYDPETVTEVNEEEVWGRLDELLQTFAFKN